MRDEHNAGSVTQMRKLLDKLEQIEGRKIAWTALCLFGVIYVAYKVERDW